MYGLRCWTRVEPPGLCRGFEPADSGQKYKRPLKGAFYILAVERGCSGGCLAVIRPGNCRKSVAGDETGSARSHRRRLAEALPAERK